MICPTCKYMATTKLVGGEYFVLCTHTCSGSSSVGSPLTHGWPTEAEAEDEFRAEEEKRKQREAEECR